MSLSVDNYVFDCVDWLPSFRSDQDNILASIFCMRKRLFNKLYKNYFLPNEFLPGGELLYNMDNMAGLPRVEVRATVSRIYFHCREKNTFVNTKQTSQVSRFCRETHGFHRVSRTISRSHDKSPGKQIHKLIHYFSQNGGPGRRTL